MKKYCEKCGKEVETKVITKNETYNVLGEDIEVQAQILVCADCNEEFYCEELDSATLVNAYNEYRKKHKLLSPVEIKEIRELYSLSQRSFSKLLNWGEKTINRYENGSIQDNAHNSLLLFLRDPKNMKAYLNDNEISLPLKQLSKLNKIVEQLIDKNKLEDVKKSFDWYVSSEASIENGFKMFDYEKFTAMVSFLAKKSILLPKTKLMKLLHYADMIFFKENGISISGIKYIHYQYGPVPDKFNILLERLELDNIAHIEIYAEQNYEQHNVVPDCGIYDDCLSEKELDVLERV